MPAEPPDPTTVMRAIDAYLDVAYGPQRPAYVKSMVATVRDWSGKFYACPVFVKDANTPPNRYSMRLGNRHYPHMKLVIERSPDDAVFFFRADTHDRHACPPEGAAEYRAFVDLMEKNQQIAQGVETGWAEAGLPTFKSWLRDDLARRGKA
jgi:hypothetical protein